MTFPNDKVRSNEVGNSLKKKHDDWLVVPPSFPSTPLKEKDEDAVVTLRPFRSSDDLAREYLSCGDLLHCASATTRCECDDANEVHSSVSNDRRDGGERSPSISQRGFGTLPHLLRVERRTADRDRDDKVSLLDRYSGRTLTSHPLCLDGENGRRAGLKIL